MTETGTFLASLAIIVAVTLLVLCAGRVPAWSGVLARGFAALCAVVAVASLLGVVAMTLHLRPSGGFYRAILEGAALAGQLVVGVALAAAIARGVARWHGCQAMGFIASRWLVAGLALFVTFAFFGFEIGKAAHDTEMREFFIGSGYPVAFMYVVMAVEIIGACGLLVARLRLIAALALGLVMLGAIATHARNGDPFSDSLDALRMLLAVASIVVLDWREQVGGATAPRSR